MNREPTAEDPVPFAVPVRLTEVESTNRHLVDLATAGLPDGSEVPDGYAVVAERQSAGRGRLGRPWEMPAGAGVLCSILLRPDLPPGQLHLAAWAVALAAVQACEETAGVEVALKWPNDLVAGGGSSGQAEPGPQAAAVRDRKVGGILSEALGRRVGDAPDRWGSWCAGVVVGVGINVNWPPDWPPADTTDPVLASIAARATSLNRIAGHRVDRTELVSGLLAHTGTWNAMLAGLEGRQFLASEYRRHCATIGREVRVELADETVTGKALDVDDAGCLLVGTGVCVRTIAAGDVVHLR